MNEREKLIEELQKDAARFNEPYLYGHVADFIIADRKRIVEPLVIIKKSDLYLASAEKPINETLKLAGANHGE